ncbi:MAG: type II toxin-antitoxin system PemK/MazF family toxin [Spirirestis rafaelensis WJT71-NPBG6]|jgi:mRNA interferase MazF|nr:type II toxin-antitoxin system PemK/MazF family toxin [Spirirestis rafaelensis WJT71-NPBG6]
MKGKVVLVKFPFDDLSSSKVRPAVCLTNPIGSNHHIILALITSRIPADLLDTDFVLDINHPDFASSGLHKPSTIRLDHLITLRKSIIQRELGTLSPDTQAQIVNKLYNLLNQ